MMPNPFAWFDNIGQQNQATTEFYEKTFGWQKQAFGPLTVIADGDNGPFASLCEESASLTGWIPYVEVDDLQIAAEKAVKNGAEIIRAEMAGPAGIATFITDPGGATMAIWKRAEGQ